MSIFSRIRMWFRFRCFSKKICVDDLSRLVETQKFLDSHPRSSVDFYHDIQSL